MNLFDDFFEEYQDNDNDNAIPVRVPKRYIRDGQDHFEYYHEEQFQMRFRFSKRVVRNTLLPLIRHSLEKINNRGLPVPSVLQLLLTLRFYATGNFQVGRNLLKFFVFYILMSARWWMVICEELVKPPLRQQLKEYL